MNILTWPIRIPNIALGPTNFVGYVFLASLSASSLPNALASWNPVQDYLGSMLRFSGSLELTIWLTSALPLTISKYVRGIIVAPTQFFLGNSCQTPLSLKKFGILPHEYRMLHSLNSYKPAPGDITKISPHIKFDKISPLVWAVKHYTDDRVYIGEKVQIRIRMEKTFRTI